MPLRLRRRCCCGDTPEPCEPCENCYEAHGSDPNGDFDVDLPEYLKLELTVDEMAMLSDCCGGTWANGCLLFRQITKFTPSNAAPFSISSGLIKCYKYFAVDPDNPDYILETLYGYYDGTEFSCGGTYPVDLANITISRDFSGAWVYKIRATIRVAWVFDDTHPAYNEDGTPTYDPAWSNGAIYEQDFSSTPPFNLCEETPTFNYGLSRTEAWFVCTDDAVSDADSLTAWGTTASLSAFGCGEVSADCANQEGGCGETTTCSPALLRHSTYRANIVLGDGSEFFVCVSCQPDGTWLGTIMFEHATCGSVTAQAEIYCDGTDWKFRITVGEVVEEYVLTMSITGQSGSAGGTNSNLCTASTSIEILVSACTTPAVPCCPEWGCCPPNSVVADVTGNFMTGTTSIRLYGDGSGSFTGSDEVQIGSLICGMAPVMKTLTLLLECVSGAWQLTITSANDSATASASSSACDPFEAEFSGMTLTPDTGCADVTFAVSVTG